MRVVAGVGGRTKKAAAAMPRPITTADVMVMPRSDDVWIGVGGDACLRVRSGAVLLVIFFL
jgi:hypothetical protein